MPKSAAAVAVAKPCTACGSPIEHKNTVSHPLFGVPICPNCEFHYNNGKFTKSGSNEIYCRFCGEGEEELILCDSCPKSFCSRCIENAFGLAELRRIKNLSDRWNCLVCAPQPLLDLCEKNNWKAGPAIAKSGRKGLICQDISMGREKFEIPVFNTVDNAPPPADFHYIAQPIAGAGAKLSNNPNFLACCSCTDNCKDPNRCECARRMGGFAYDSHGFLRRDKKCGVYECNSRCSCHKQRCKNRLVGLGPQLRLEVFRCENPLKGFGVKCKDRIEPGTFICEYIGEIVNEKNADNCDNDEYLFNLDHWSRSCACQKQAELGLKQQPADIAPAVDVSAALTSEEETRRLLRDDDELFQLLKQSGAIQRAQDAGRKLLEDPESYLRDLLGEQEDKPQQQDPQEQQLRGNSNGSISNGSGSSSNSSSSRAGGTENLKRTFDSSACAESDAAAAAAARKRSYEPTWADYQQEVRCVQLESAQNILKEHEMNEADEREGLFIINARRYGNIARFVNHSCAPNCEMKTVFTESHDPRLLRIALFSCDSIPAGTEITYSYNYDETNVEGKTKACFCGAPNCRRRMY